MNEKPINRETIREYTSKIAMEQLRLLAERSHIETESMALAGMTNAMYSLMDLVLRHYKE